MNITRILGYAVIMSVGRLMEDWKHAGAAANIAAGLLFLVAVVVADLWANR